MSTTFNSSPAAESIAGNEDLLAEFLIHFPARSLIRFKSVSKQWQALISGQRFSYLHTRRNRNPKCSALLFFSHSLSSATELLSPNVFIPLRADGGRSSRPPFFSALESDPILRDLMIVQSCNGLLLLTHSDLDVDFAYFVCNPTINQMFTLPDPDETGEVHQLALGVNLAFDPKKWDGYKVFCIWKSTLDKNQHGIDAYVPETGQWRRAIDFHRDTLPFDLEFFRGVYCDGRIHWLSHTESSAFLDVESETIRSLPLPPPIKGLYIKRFPYLGESKGHLHLVEIRTNSVSHFNVLELEKETLVWSVKYRVNLDVVGREFDEMFQSFNGFRFNAFSILAVVLAEREEDTTLSLFIPGKVISYNFNSGFTGLLREVGDKWLRFKGYSAYQFIETLYPVSEGRTDIR